MSDITNIAVSAGNVVPVDTLGGQATVKVNSGGPVYYADNAQVSAANNQGNITAGNSVTFTSPKFITAAAGVQASVTLTLFAGSSTAPGAPQDVVLGSDGTVGGAGGTPLTTLDNVPAAVADVSLHSHKLIAVGDATAATDGLNQQSGDGRYIHQDGTGMPTSVVRATSYITPSGGDDAATINAAITTNCDIVLGVGTFVLNSPISIPRSATGVRIRGGGRYATVLQPAAGAVRVIDFPYVADYDTYQNVTLEEFGIDASNLAVPVSNQSLVGNLITGSWKARANFKNIVCRRINVTGLVTNATASNGVYEAFSFGSRQGGTTVAVGSNGQTLPQATLNVASTTGFPAAGTLKVGGQSGDTVTYTGVTGTTFTGCTGGTRTLATGDVVTEATQTSLTGFVWEDIAIAGGNYGFVVIADCITSTSAVNVSVDDINWNRLTHDSGTVPLDSNANQGGNQIGSQGIGGTYRVTDCKFANALDTALEVDAPQFAVVRGCVSTDARNASFFARNFYQPQDLNSQTVIFRDCHARVISSQPTATGHTGAGFQISHSSAPCPNLNHMIVEGCTFTTSAPQQTATGQAVLCSGNNVNRITIRDFTAVIDGCADTSAGAQGPNLLLLKPVTACHTTISNLTIRASGSTTNASWAPIWVRWGTTGASLKHVVEIDVVSITQTVTGVGAGNTRFVQIGSGANSNTYRGSVSRLTVDTATGDTATKALSILSAASNMTIDANGELLVSRCDFSQNAGYDVIDLSTSATNFARIVYRDNKWGSFGPSNPAGGGGKGRQTNNSYFAATSFTTATGNQYLGGFSSRIILSGGSGVTAIDLSQDGGGNYDNLLTQAAAAIPQPVIARLENGDFLKLTFTTTAPTVAVLPDK